MITGKNYIGNKLSAKGDVTHSTINPKLNIENPTPFFEATQAEVNEAVTLAWDAFKVYRKVPGSKRAAFLNAIADEILALDQELIDMYTTESGLPEGRAIGERGRTVYQLRTFADLVSNEDWRENVIDEAIPDREPLPKEDLRKTLIPLGPVVVFAASNFPLAFSTAGGDTASALAAGCPVIVKAHAMHSGTAELVASAIIKAAEKTGMPNGVFSNIMGRGRTVGTALVKHPKVKAVGFTGSISGGRALFDLASQREEPIPVFAEMGSINPVIITSKAVAKRSEAIATTYAGSITLGTGQFCTNPGLILTIESDKTQAFIEDLANKTIAIEPQCMLGPNIKSGFVENGESVIAQEGVEVVGKIKGDIEANYAASYIASVSGTDFLANPKMHQEVFGPFSLVVRCKDETQLIQIVDGLEGQLTGTIIAEEEEYATLHDLVDALENRVGRIIFNGVPTGVEVCPSMQHGGPYPASTDSRFTAVGTGSIKRWVRPISYQSFPDALLPMALKR
ncbi:aldehyde dehydrogenase (NADP(+)) [Snuella sedimenti]|uniref:Aldehyde dehydrogenase (NADP(+)) n=1 Tax=Snuella sedimenti TaxID=2798802 RepID=A0A8J7J3I0_9FLAO|nr:aldehyde dehydrogenase (NADP(+)) [Snuella sedimenti]MBJ6367733.1 aldehyde dehydrogenase (NADP(+)) [Snuella sedimenti]